MQVYYISHTRSAQIYVYIDNHLNHYEVIIHT